MHPITVASGFRRRKPAHSGCPDPMRAIGCWRGNWCRVRLKAFAGWCAQPAEASRNTALRRGRPWRRVRLELFDLLPKNAGMNTMAHPIAWPVHARFDGPIVMIGFGSIGRGTLPLLERHIAFDRSKFVVIDPVDTARALLDERKLKFLKVGLTKENHREVLTPLLTAGPGRGMIVNLSVDTSSADLMDLCKDINCHYIDTVAEPWPGFYDDPKITLSQRSNYALRERVLDLRRRRPGGVTAVNCCGANPGMVSWFVKQALLDVARDTGVSAGEPNTRDEWAALMRRVGIKGVHVAERDTQ